MKKTISITIIPFAFMFATSLLAVSVLPFSASAQSYRNYDSYNDYSSYYGSYNRHYRNQYDDRYNYRTPSRNQHASFGNSYSNSYASPYSYSRSNAPRFSYSNMGGGCMFGGIAGAITCGSSSGFDSASYSQQNQLPQYSYSNNMNTGNGGIAGALVAGFR